MRKLKVAIYNLTSDVIVTSFQVGLTPNLDTTSARYSGRCVQSFASLSLRVATISSQNKGGTVCPPPPAAGGWRGGPAAAGLIVQGDSPAAHNASALY